MRYIVVGLGKLGSSMAKELTQMGNEVIGVDKNIDCVERLKAKIATAICLNITDASCLSVLPQNGINAIIITVREDIGRCLTVYTVMKQIKASRIYVCVADAIQYAIVNSLGITNIIYPEKDVAKNYAMALEMPEYQTSYRVDDDHFVVEMKAPKWMVGNRIDEDTIMDKFHLRLLAVKRRVEIRNEVGVPYSDFVVLNPLGPSENRKIMDNDLIVVYGHYKDIKEL
ncbi:MAG: NAD-binding protein [Bacteroidales bacterium]|nr:NAD-binding protein [Bacteroidales bacterium]